MSLDVRVRKEAERDIEQAAQWYERQRAGLGQLFLNEVQRALAVLGEVKIQDTHRFAAVSGAV